MVLPLQDGIEIVGLIGSLLRSLETHAIDIADDYLQRLTVLFVHGKQHCRYHYHHHHHGGRAGADTAFEQKEKRYANERAAAEADELSFREIEQHFCFYFG